ncbi:MAG: GTP-binding protein [Nannocystaceae bacterium]|nr:GTP-binding protein [Nannocystaceae bacterium]
MSFPIPVTVITGFLGAGKSTLLDRWLRQLPAKSTAVLINEQGRIGIDGELLAERVSRIREVTGGCICCQAQAELDAALAEFAASTPTPTRILVETSGAASPSGVLRALTLGSARASLRLDGVVTVLDASRADEALSFALTIEQLGFADVVVLSHADACGDVELAALEERLGRYAPGAAFARGRRGQLEDEHHGSLLKLLAARSGVLRAVPSQTGKEGGHGVDSVSLSHSGELDGERFSEWVETSLGAVQARILRVKGILAVHGVDERVIVQGVGQAVEVTLGSPWSEGARASRLVVLGLALDEDALHEGFGSCIYADAGI